MTYINGFLISAPHSGSGKTTVSLAIMAALTRRGIAVSPFKCGPDFIDPGYHHLVTGVKSINLDGWMCSENFVNSTFSHWYRRESVAVIEGAMGLFDGIGASSQSGSSAQIARLTGAPVVLIVNAKGMAASCAAVVNGFAAFDSQVRVAGVIFNNVGSDSHATLLVEAVNKHCPGIKCFGSIPRDSELAIPSRHLGLVTADDNPLSVEFINRLADIAENCLNIDSLAALTCNCQPIQHETVSMNTSEHAVIAVARDAAFCFMYDDNVRLLKEAGAEIVYFSPLNDSLLPDGTTGIYLPGGYPELYQQSLAENISMRDAVVAAYNGGMPIYGECGGFVYLTRGLTGQDNNLPADFTGVFPTTCRMLQKRKALGYREIRMIDDACIGKTGAVARGHEFHYSEANSMAETVDRCFEVSRKGVTLGTDGYKSRNCLASYIHLHFGSNPDIAPSFVASCHSYILNRKNL